MEIDTIDSSLLNVTTNPQNCSMEIDVEKPKFLKITAQEANQGVEYRRIPVPFNRYTPLKENWKKVYEPLVTHLKLHVRMNTQKQCVEIKTSPLTEEIGHLQRASDFLKAFMLGFDIKDATALLRLDDLYIDSFDIKDVKTLRGDHLSRAIGRIAGKDGKTKFTIENTTKTRIVLADAMIHIMGSFQNIRMARDAICSLILGTPPGKVYGNLKILASRMKNRF